MAYLNRSTSPDPITLPSSPLGLLSGNARAKRRKPTQSLAPSANNGAPFSSPAKSFVVDTGDARDASPWRIRVTVEAEPKEGSSPAKKITKTTKVPLKGSGSSSPAKRTSARKAAIGGDTELEVKRAPRRRKGTPVRPQSTRAQSTLEEIQDDADDDVHLSSASPPTQAMSRKRTSPAAPTARTKRLSRARQELDLALQDAVGHDTLTAPDHVDDAGSAYDDMGDMTMANEDFTMISIDTLQSMKGNTSQLLDTSGVDLADKSVASVSYMPSSPPVQHKQDTSHVYYPDITAQASAAKAKPKYTPSAISTARSGDLADSSMKRSSTADKSPRRVAERDAGHLVESQHEPVSFAGATVEHAIVIEDHTTAGAEESGEDPGAEIEDADIWAEEASRSFEEEQEQSKAASHGLHLSELLGNGLEKPPRPKIPRTWRRSSGIQFNYTDSPEYGALRKPSATSTDADGVESRSSGVLTPPSTDDEENNHQAAHEYSAEEGDTSFTQPDAEGTRLEVHRSPTRPHQQEALSPLSDSSGSGTSPDGEGDTGLFWQTNLPNVYPTRTRPKYQRQRPAIDLSQLLDSKQSPHLPKGHNSDLPIGKIFSASRKLATRKSHATTSTEKVISSPMRRSLLKSSKTGGSTAPNVNMDEDSRSHFRSMPAGDQAQEQSSTLSTSRSGHESTLDSFQSQASDQRQLLNEMRTASSSQKPIPGHDDEDAESTNDTSDEIDGRADSGFHQRLEEDHDEPSSALKDELTISSVHSTCTTQRMVSYEEHLNLESPQKIRVKFNDSEGNSSLLAPRKEYPPIFGACNSVSAPDRRQQPSEHVSSNTPDPVAQTTSGIFSRLSTNFWSAVVRPSGPAEILPDERHQPEPVYPHLLRRDIRSRYGVLSDQHPWTMAHMRTLHRLLNSCTSGKSDSIVPKSGPLPLDLTKLVGKKLVSATPDFSWIFTRQHGYVVDAFMQTLVPEHIAQAIRDGEMEFLGDSEAKKHRGLLAGRHGDMVVFEGVDGVKEPRGAIGRDWVVKVLGNCVMANIDSARRGNS